MWRGVGQVAEDWGDGEVEAEEGRGESGRWRLPGSEGPPCSAQSLGTWIQEAKFKSWGLSVGGIGDGEGGAPSGWS